MKYSQLFGKTRYNVPHDAKSKNAELLTQAGFVDKMAAGIYNMLPLGFRVLNKINTIIREEMTKVGAQEVLMPALHPIELWKTSGRVRTMDDILYHSKGAGDKDFVFGPSHEEAVTPLAAKFVQSYKDLPFAVFQLQTKFRNEPRAKSGLLRGREFGMKDMYSFHESEEDLDAYYEKVIEAYTNVYTRCGLKAYVVEASGGAFSDKYSHEFSVITPAGEDTIIIDEKNGTAANTEVASFRIHSPEDENEKEEEMKEVPIERGMSVEENAKAHDVPEWKILKSVVYRVGNGYIGVCIRGDLKVNEHKLQNYLKKTVRAASPDELAELGLVQGFISPVFQGKSPIPFIADQSVKHVKNFVTGANKKDLDLVNVNVGRDFIIEDFADLVLLDAKALESNGEVRVEKAIEAGNIFKLGTIYSESFNLMYTGKDGKKKPVVMGCYGIGTTRLMGTVVEASHDENGIIWPKTIAPYQVHLVTIGSDDEVVNQAAKLYEEMLKDGIEVLYDDRDESAGKKLKDADLIGIPLRIVLSNRTLKENGVEWRERNQEKGTNIPLTDVIKKVRAYAGSK